MFKGLTIAHLDEETLLRYTEQTDSEFVTLSTEYLAKLQKNIKLRLCTVDSEMFMDLREP